MIAVITKTYRRFAGYLNMLENIERDKPSLFGKQVEYQFVSRVMDTEAIIFTDYIALEPLPADFSEIIRRMKFQGRTHTIYYSEGIKYSLFEEVMLSNGFSGIIQMINCKDVRTEPVLYCVAGNNYTEQEILFSLSDIKSEQGVYTLVKLPYGIKRESCRDHAKTCHCPKQF